MKPLLLVLLLLGIMAPTWAEPWEEAGKTSVDNTLVIAWSTAGHSQLMPYWKQALAIDAASEPEEQMHWKAMLDHLGLSLEQWLELFDGAGHWSYDALHHHHRFRFELAADARLSELLQANFGAENGTFQKQMGDNLEVSCDHSQFTIRLGPVPSKAATLASTSEFADARHRLGQTACDILIFARGDGRSFDYAALTVDLKAQAAHGFVKLPTANTLAEPDGLEAQLVRARPAKLATFLAVDLKWLDASFDTLQNILPAQLQGFGKFLAARRAPGGLFATFRGQGLMGMTGDPTEAVTGVAPDSSFYAVSRYQDLRKVESFLHDLEYQTSLHTLAGCQKNLEVISWALLRWEVDLHREVSTDLNALVPELLTAIPECPSVGRPTYALRKVGDKDWVLYCKGHHHPQTAPDYPRYTRYEAGDSGELRPPTDLFHFSRVGDAGRAAYKLSSGQRISVDTSHQLVYLADGPADLDFLKPPAPDTPLPALAQANFEWGKGSLVYLDYFDTAAGIEKLRRHADQEYPGVTELLVRSLLDGIDQAGTTEASNAFRVEPDGLAYQGLGLWASPAVLSPVAGLSVWIQSAIRQEEVSKARLCRHNVLTIARALDAYSRDHGGPYPDRLSDLVPRYLPAVPVCPSTGTDTYSAGYQWDQYTKLDQHSGFYLVCCKGRNHRGARWKEDKPAYQSETGVSPNFKDEP